MLSTENAVLYLNGKEMVMLMMAEKEGDHQDCGGSL